MESNDCLDTEDDLFRQSFKYYKRRDVLPDLSEVIDFNNYQEFRDKITPLQLEVPSLAAIAGLKPIEKWNAYQTNAFPGFIFITNPFLPGFHRYWIQRCLEDFPVKPNKTNLDIHMELTEQDNIWEMGPRTETWNRKTVLERLRWATLGFHHDWNTKEYSPDCHSDFPVDLSYMAKYVALAIGYKHFSAEAGVVNYYHLNSTLSGHNDHSELDHEAPLISFSFGHTALFLVGADNKEVKPEAMYLRNGDIAIMMGQSRLAFHAVPKIIETDEEYIKQCLKCDEEEIEKLQQGHSEQGTGASNVNGGSETNKCKDKQETNTELSKLDLQTLENGVQKLLKDSTNNEAVGINAGILKVMQKVKDEDTWIEYQNYLLKGRINMNVRQVFKPGDSFETASYKKEVES